MRAASAVRARRTGPPVTADLGGPSQTDRLCPVAAAQNAAREPSRGLIALVEDGGGRLDIGPAHDARLGLVAGELGEPAGIPEQPPGHRGAGYAKAQQQAAEEKQAAEYRALITLAQPAIPAIARIPAIPATTASNPPPEGDPVLPG